VTVLTLDLGTSATKAALWDGARLVSIMRAPLTTSHPHPGWAEQNPESWWQSVFHSCGALRSAERASYERITAVGFSAARETFALFDETLQPLSPGILWSDRRAEAQVLGLGNADAFRERTGVIASAGCCAAKAAWMRAHASGEFMGARWLLAPRDFVFARLTDLVLSDRTLASRTGWYGLDGSLLAGAPVERLPPIERSISARAAVATPFTESLGLAVGTPVVLGAGDRACEALGVGARPDAPMVSWGTTANVSIPHPGPIGALPRFAQVSRGALDGFVVEAGLSAAGSALDWLASLTGRAHDQLLVDAAAVAPGAAGVLALPWLAGARAPWWHSETHAAFLGITDGHGPAELARAIIEGVALDVARCIELIAPDSGEIELAGGGSRSDLWRQTLAGVTGLPLVRRAIDDAGSVGARLLLADALGEPLSVEDVNPVVARETADPALLTLYREVRARADDAARAVLGSGG
jgi:xylulokinase